MSIQGDDAEKLAAAMSNLTNELEAHPAVKSSSVKTSLPLLAAMIPLIGIMAGIWFNYSSESTAREDEKASRERDEEIRVMELAVPVYRNLAVQGAELEEELTRCRTAIDEWWNTPESSDEEEAAQQEIDKFCEENVQLAYLEVKTALEESKIVSNEDLIAPVEEFEQAFTDLQQLQTLLVESKGVDCVYTSDFDACDDGDCVTVEDEYYRLWDELGLIGFCVFEEIRQNVLLQKERSSTELSPECLPYVTENENESE
jgi:hypothetical protein